MKFIREVWGEFGVWGIICVPIIFILIFLGAGVILGAYFIIDLLFVRFLPILCGEGLNGLAYFLWTEWDRVINKIFSPPRERPKPIPALAKIDGMYIQDKEKGEDRLKYIARIEIQDPALSNNNRYRRLSLEREMFDLLAEKSICGSSDVYIFVEYFPSRMLGQEQEGFARLVKAFVQLTDLTPQDFQPIKG